MITALFTEIGNVITAFAGVIGNGFESLLAIFWDSTASTPGFTLVGILSLVGVGMALVYWAFRLIRNLIHLRG